MAEPPGAAEPLLALVPPVEPEVDETRSLAKKRPGGRALDRDEYALVRSNARVKVTAAGLNAGHRARLQKRLYEVGHEGLADHEILEGLLFQFIPRVDTKPVAKRLLLQFGSLLGVLNATIDELRGVEGVGAQTAVGLKFVQACAMRALRREAVSREKVHRFQGLDDVLAYLRIDQAARRREQFRVLFLNARNRLIRDEVLWEGTVNHAPAYPREIVRRALELGATALILVHNHPSGDPTPSRDDIGLTAQVAEAAKVHGIAVHDHLVVSASGHASLRGLGYLSS
ncbi:RadC family protein [Thermaurantiacus sp.]